MRSVGHVFEKVDCVDPERLTWSKAQWGAWRKEPIFSEFIEPTRNLLLKEFRGGLQIQSEAFGQIAIVADPSAPGGASRITAFDARQAVDLLGRPVVPLLNQAIAFWDQRIGEAEEAFRAMSDERR